MQQLINLFVIVQDFGEWAAIGGLTIAFCRAEMRARAAERHLRAVMDA